MARRSKRTFTLASAWTDLVVTGFATATTLSVRVPQLMAGSMTEAESRRMVGEKVSASAEGFVAGAAVAARIASKRLARPAPYRAFEDLLEIAEATARPARRRVKSNAVRLTKT